MKPSATNETEPPRTHGKNAKHGALSPITIRLYQCILYVESFTVAEIARIFDLAGSTISNSVNALRKRGWIEVVRGEPSHGGRPRKRYQVTSDLGKRRDFFDVAYGNEALDAAAPAALRGDAFKTACRLIDNVKIRSTSIPWIDVMFPHARLETLAADLDLAEEYLEVAFYEQSWTAREGLIGVLIHSQRDELRLLRERLSEGPSAKTTAKPDPRHSDTIARVLRRFRGGKETSARTSARSKSLPEAGWPEAIRKRLGNALSDLDAFRYAIICSALSRDEWRSFSEAYAEIDNGWSFDALYNRTYMNLLAGAYERADADWQGFVSHSSHQALQSKTLLELVKSYLGLICESPKPYRVAAVNTKELPKLYETMAHSDICAGNIEVATADPYYLSLATGDYSPIELRETIPIELGTAKRRERQLPLPSRDRKLVASSGIAPFLDVPGPIPMKLAVGLDGIGVDRSRAFADACSFDTEERSYMFVPTEATRGELPAIDDGEWLPAKTKAASGSEVRTGAASAG